MTAPADFTAAVQSKFAQVTLRPTLDHPAINVPMGDVIPVLKYLRDEFAFDLLMDVTGIDWAEGASPRFTTVWHLHSTTTHAYVRVAADCASDSEPSAPTAVELWAGANWHERETWDLLGIRFTGHPDLRRILMWDEYPYHPLRKDFPLAGIETALPDVEVVEETNAKVIAAPMAGGPFVASSAGEVNPSDAEPRAKDESWNERREKPE
jgi:NADH-quinone oxidoreductase subunit C